MKKNLILSALRCGFFAVPTFAAQELPEIRKRANVGFHDPVKQEDVKWLSRTFDSLILEITAGAAK